MNKLKNIVELIDRAESQFADNIAFQIRNRESYDKITYKQFVKDVRSLAAYFHKNGYSNKHISIIGENSYEYAVTHYGAIYCGSVIVPIDKDLTPAEISSLLTMSDTKFLVYSSAYDDSVESIFDDHKDTKFVKITKRAKEGTFLDLLAQGEAIIAKEGIFKADPEYTSMCEIVLTSGTTGVSKGVMLSHENLLTNIDSCLEVISFDATTLSLLPMHHTFESTLGVLLSIYQGTTTSINNSVKYIAQNMKMFRPTELLVVPLIAESLYNNIWKSIRESGKEKSVKTVLSISRFLLKMGIDLRRVFFKKILEAFGGRLNSLFCGGALLDKDVAIGLYEFGVNVYIGYGITECSPIIAGNVSLRPSKYGSCGQAFSCNEIKLVDLNENNEGEIYVKGTNVMLGYYKNPEATAEVMEDGWYKTGDIGKYDKDGFLYITGRKKNVIVLKNGKNIYPEELEGYIAKIKYIQECLVTAISDGLEQTAIQAEIFLNQDLIESEKIENPENFVREEIEKLNDTLAYYKRITAVKFRETEFNKTTSRKIKRHNQN
ncbi:MAG: AMP-binding protein [Rikenellaceae bacterium]